jgi:hypothetical protein
MEFTEESNISFFLSAKLLIAPFSVIEAFHDFILLPRSFFLEPS